MYERQASMPPARRTQAERSAGTREALISAGRRLFATQGFAAVTLDGIVAAAGVTRGALYHHFADKTALFAEVFETVEAELATRMGERIAAAGASDPVEVMRLGADFWLDACSDPETQRIVLVDAPAVLGWTRWTEIGNRYNLGLVRALLEGAIETGRIPAQPVEATALMILGAMREATLYIALATDHERAREDAGAVMERLLNALGDA
ncbi:TetR family transcriptional regulator [Mycolicibacterium conceptionense]|nr:TetR family transcriptional regulator [Mycolicibacterium conceptionense]